jgi:NADH:ubiquinone oxidoreductase subunit 5 (subunit L)/multisubunit Na+/H+ antiporter MnhA subunit
LFEVTTIVPVLVFFVTQVFSQGVSSVGSLASVVPIAFSETANDLVAWTLLEHSVWSLLVAVVSFSILGLWLFSSYLEFDAVFVGFALRLLVFLLTVWLVISSATLLGVLLAWELVGLVSFLLIWTWAFRSFTSSSAFSAIGFNRVGDIGFVLLVAVVALTPTVSSNVLALAFFAVLSLKSVTVVSFL